MREDLLKAEVDLHFVAAPAHLFRMTIETSFPLGDGSPRRPSVAAPVANGLALIVENNSGRVFIDGKRRIDELTLDGRLEFPSALRADDAGFYLSDNEGLKAFDYTGQRQMLLRTFLSIHDFAFVTADAVAVNPFMDRSDAPVVALVRAPGGAIAKTWGGERKSLVPGSKVAHLASCGGRIVVGLAHEPVVFVLDGRLESEVGIELPFPRKAELLSLASDEQIVEPAPGVVTAPTFVGGVACVDESSFFVLLDLPWLCILEYDLNNRLVAIHHADYLRQGRHYQRLNAKVEGNEIRFIAIAEDAVGPRAVVEAVAVPMDFEQEP